MYVWLSVQQHSVLLYSASIMKKNNEKIPYLFFNFVSCCCWHSFTLFICTQMINKISNQCINHIWHRLIANIIDTMKTMNVSCMSISSYNATEVFVNIQTSNLWKKHVNSKQKVRQVSGVTLIFLSHCFRQ